MHSSNLAWMINLASGSLALLRTARFFAPSWQNLRYGLGLPVLASSSGGHATLGILNQS